MKIITSDSEQYRRSDGYFYIIYRVDCISTGKFYIGSRKTKNLNDSYYGSPGKTNEYREILNECKSSKEYNNLIFTILKFTTKFKRWEEEARILISYENNEEIYNIKSDVFTNNHFTHEEGDPQNPFIYMKDKLSKLNTEKNKKWSGIYKFTHPKEETFIGTITEMIESYKSRDVIIDRGMMNLIGRLGHLRDGYNLKGKLKTLCTSNKYYDWTCEEVIKKPTHTVY